jgi:hypothetical protein
MNIILCDGNDYASLVKSCMHSGIDINIRMQRLLESSLSETELYRALDEMFNGGKMPDDASLSALVDAFVKEGDEIADGFK